MRITLLGQEVDFTDEPHQEVRVAKGIFIASIHQYPATVSAYSHDWILEGRVLGVRPRYGEGRASSLEEAAKAVNELATKLSREQREMFSRVGEIP